MSLCSSVSRMTRSAALPALKIGGLMPLLVFALSLPTPSAPAEAKDKGSKPAKHEVKHQDRRDSDRARDQGSQGDGDQMRFKGMDRNNDGLISRGEWRGNDNSFNIQDWNRDGVISAEELRSGARTSDGEGRRDSDLELDRFDVLDADRNGRVDRGEWDRSLSRSDGDRSAFTRLDTNRDGVLTPEEFLFRTNREQVPDTLLRDLDGNRDGKLSRVEWQGRQDFDHLDRNHDGYLSRDELARR